MIIKDSGYGSGDGFWSHNHSNQWEFHLFITGSGMYYNELLSLSIVPGMLTYSKPYERHYCRADGQGNVNFYYLGFCFEDTDSHLSQTVDDVFSKHTHLLLNLNACSQISQIIQKSKTANSHIVKSAEHLLSSLLYEIAANDNRRYGGQEGDLASEMLDLLHQNTYEKINLDDIVSKMGFDKSYLIRVFKQKYQITPIKYLLKLKIDAACYMLENSMLSIKEIAYKLKFYDEYYFSRQFKELKGCNPRKFRNNSQKKSMPPTNDYSETVSVVNDCCQYI